MYIVTTMRKFISAQHLPAPAKKARAYCNLLVDEYPKTKDYEFARNAFANAIVGEAKSYLHTLLLSPSPSRRIEPKQLGEFVKQIKELVDGVDGKELTGRLLARYPGRQLHKTVRKKGFAYVVVAELLSLAKVERKLTQPTAALYEKMAEAYAEKKYAKVVFTKEENRAWERKVKQYMDIGLIRSVPFVFDGGNYELLIGIDVLKTAFGNERYRQFAILPRTDAAVRLMETIQDPSFEHFTGAVAIGHVLTLKKSLRLVEEVQSDANVLLRRHGRTERIPALKMAISALRASEVNSEGIFLATPFRVAHTYPDGELPFQKLKIYYDEAEESGGELVYDQDGLLVLPTISGLTSTVRGMEQHYWYYSVR